MPAERIDGRPVPLGRRTWAVLAVASLVGAAAFAWPFLLRVPGTRGSAHAGDAPWILMGLVPLLVAVVLAELADGSLDAKSVALLGMLAACGAGLRMVSPGVGGIEPTFFLLFPAARVFGRGFGFVLGALTLAVSAVVTGGIGPWLPSQMLAAAWIGFGAGCLPPASGRIERWLLAGYAAVALLAYGAITDLWFWPFLGTVPFHYVPGAGPLENLHRFVLFQLTTSLGFDVPAALTNAGLVLLFGRAVLGALRRASRRAAFGAVPVYGPASGAGPVGDGATPALGGTAIRARSSAATTSSANAAASATSGRTSG